MKRHEGWGHLDSINLYSYPKEIEKNRMAPKTRTSQKRTLQMRMLQMRTSMWAPKTDLSALMTLLISLMVRLRSMTTLSDLVSSSENDIPEDS